MAAHVEQQLVEAVAALLTGLATTGTRVFQDRVYPLEDSDLPCINVTTESEVNEYLTVHNARLEAKTISLNVECVAKSATVMMSTLRQIRKEVEVVMATNKRIGGLAKALRLTNTATRKDASGDQPVGVATMTFEIDIYCNETTPDVAIP